MIGLCTYYFWWLGWFSIIINIQVLWRIIISIKLQLNELECKTDEKRYSHTLWQVYFMGCLSYLAPGLRPSYPSVGPRPTAPTKFSTNLLLLKVQLLWLCEHYFQWFIGYLNHVDLFMSHVHVLKKLPYCLMCT